MTFIGNNCADGYLYKYLGWQYNHPFIFTTIDVRDFMRLIANDGNIDESKLVFRLENGEREKRLLNKRELIPIAHLKDIDVDINFVHHEQHNDKNVPVRIGVNLQYKYILAYTIKKFLQRLKRYNKDDKKIYIFDDCVWCEKYKIIDFVNTIKRNKVRIYVLTRKKDWEQYDGMYGIRVIIKRRKNVANNAKDLLNVLIQDGIIKQKR